MTSSFTNDVIKYILRMKHMPVANQYKWFCSSTCSETQVITNKRKNDVIRGFSNEQFRLIILPLMRESKKIFFSNFFAWEVFFRSILPYKLRKHALFKNDLNLNTSSAHVLLKQREVGKSRQLVGEFV